MTRTSRPSWFTPGRLLLIFSLTNLMVYLDRGVIASNGVNGSPRSVESPRGSGIQGHFGLSNFQDGLLATAFLVGLLLASPVFSESCKHYNAFRLLAIGMGTWAVATLGCGLAPTYLWLMACRMLVGVGEASFVALAAPFIDDFAPPQYKARWLAVFYLCIPVGFAAGYIYGGLMAAWFGAQSGWRTAFIVESCVMVPFVVFTALASPLHLHGTAEDGLRQRPWSEVVREFLRDLRQIASQRVWVNMCLAYTLYTAVLGVYAFWGPKAGKAIFDLKDEQADLLFGGVTVLTGTLGTLSGGLVLDRLGSSLRNANLTCGVSTLVGCLLLVPSFLGARNFLLFIVLFAMGELALFGLQAPVVAIGMWSVPPALRPLGISMTTLAIHLGGDVPSPPLLGWMQSQLERGKSEEAAHQQWRISMSVMSLLLVLSGALFLRGCYLSTSAQDYRKLAESSSEVIRDEEQVEEVEDSNVVEPLLHDDTEHRAQECSSHA